MISITGRNSNDAPNDLFYYTIVENGNALGQADVKDGLTPTLNSGEEDTLLLQLAAPISEGRDAQVKIETANGAIFVGTIIAGQQSG